MDLDTPDHRVTEGIKESQYRAIREIKDLRVIKDRRAIRVFEVFRDTMDLMDTKVDRVIKDHKVSKGTRVPEDPRGFWVTRDREDIKGLVLNTQNFADCRETGDSKAPRAKEVFRVTVVSRETEVSRVVLPVLVAHMVDILDLKVLKDHRAKEVTKETLVSIT